MIAKTEVMELLLEACPSYKNRWDSYLKSNYSVGDEQLLYVDIGDFVHHMMDLYRNRKLDEYEPIFDVIERLHIDGDDYVKDAATVGFLEGIQNISLNNEISPEVFVPYLKPISLIWWEKLNDFWSGKIKVLR